MYRKFETENSIKAETSNYCEGFVVDGKKYLKNFPQLLTVVTNFGAHTIENGLFRIHSFGSSYKWTNLTEEYFYGYRGKFYCFGYDWAGRQFGLSKEDKELIYMFDPATAEVFELESSIEEFFNEILVDYKEDTFNQALFNELCAVKEFKLSLNECFGFKVPLFVGGQDKFANYEVNDMEVYWEINRQIYEQIKLLPPGTNVQISFE